MARNREGVLNGVVKIQALVRGYIVRKQFMKLRKEYVNLVMCIEDHVLQVTWKSKDKLCFPSYVVCLKGKARCEKVADNIDKEDVDITLNSDSVSLGKTCPKITQSSCATTTEHCKSKGEYLPEKTPKENQGIKKLENDLDLLEKCQTYNPPLVATDVEHTVENGESSISTSGESCKDVPKLQEEISPSNDDARPQEMTGISKIGLQAMFQVPVTMYPKDRTELLKLRQDLAMELLWIQQAIESRKSYLITKKQLEEKAVNPTLNPT